MTDKSQEERFARLRRKVIEREFGKLNDMQRQAVLTTEGPLLLLAGAGSGKTTVLINRIANIIRYGRGSDSAEVPEGITEADADFLEDYLKSPTEDKRDRAEVLCALDPCPPWRIIAITFTNKAADELKDRLERMLGPDARDIWAMTFHSACVRILRRDIERLGYASGFTIYDTTDSGALIKRIIKEMNLDDKTYNYRGVLSQISKAKDAMTGPEQFLQSAEKSGDPRKRNIGRIYLEYSNRMKNADALDFDDIILLTVKLLLENSDIREYYQRKFRYVLIDEYQDTNNLQYLFAGALAGGHGNICVVGDDDQSIYKFRGATIENILSFEKQYKNARLIRLEQNYRSTGYILAASNQVIKHNTGRKGKNLWTDKDMGEKPTLYVAADERDEAQFVAGKVIAGVAGGDNFRDFAVLYRMNAQSNQIEFAFKRSGIPYRVIGGTKFFDRAEIKDMLAYLCVISNPADEMRLMRVVNQPPRGIGQATLDTVAQLSEMSGRSAFDIMSNADMFDALSRPAARLRQFTAMVDELRELEKTLSLPELYEEVIRKTGYVTMLESRKNDENTTRIENVNELKTNIVTYMKENPEGNLAGFLDEISLYTDLDNLDRSQDCVSVMTMHSAKGLEFPTVFIIGAEEGVFPGMRTIGEPDEMEEERRLCYVAMTRAKQRLYFTCARRRMLFGKTVSGQVSRFVDEIGDENINRPSETGFAFGGESERWDRTPDRGWGNKYGTPSSGGYDRERPRYTQPRDYSARRPSVKKPVDVPKPTAAKPEIVFAEGDSVNHKAFGPGVVTKVQPTGNDALIEVEFEKVGTKRLMMKSAASFMKKA